MNVFEKDIFRARIFLVIFWLLFTYLQYLLEISPNNILAKWVSVTFGILIRRNTDKALAPAGPAGGISFYRRFMII